VSEGLVKYLGKWEIILRLIVPSSFKSTEDKMEDQEVMATVV